VRMGAEEKVLLKTKLELSKFFETKCSQLFGDDNIVCEDICLPSNCSAVEKVLASFCLKAMVKIETLMSGRMVDEAGGVGEGEGVDSGDQRGRRRTRSPESGERRRGRERSRDGWSLAGGTGLKKDISKLIHRVNILESESKENSQRLRKGTVICNSADFLGQKKVVNLLKPIMPARPIWDEEETPVEVPKNGPSVLQQVLDLIEKKYSVVVPLGEVAASHFIPNGNYVLRFNYRNPDDSAWPKLVKAMKDGGDKDVNFFVNFNLTRERLALLKEVRVKKKSKQLEKYSIDENGAIKIRIQSRWLRLTHHYTEDGAMVCTYTVNKFNDLFK
jgi:hypothetical protein